MDRITDQELTEDAWAPYPNADRLKAEDDLRIRMFALDMAVTALPSLASSIDSEDTKLHLVRRASGEFEKILRGEPSS